ncbi:GNAT family N-acetyltransferase [Microvirga antarctica]|uniref:GNAT family N-acetyltransferase n=1 Tax=Microvirga antarctica TaxID=2819233 RepID=UPI001B307A09|nr:GNAT family N-acetyltransferase [Microvirga antarctica]
MTSPAPITLNLDGYTDIPAGKVASIVTYLEMHEPPATPAGSDLRGYALDRLTTDLARYRALFSQIGDPWLWFGHAVLDDSEIAGLLLHPDVEASVLAQDGLDLGLLVLDFRAGEDAELMYFGLVPGMTGRGVGRFLMDEAIRRAFSRPVTRFFVHTCSLDHPDAVSFYVRSGFTPYKRAVEVADDPRLRGFLPLTCAPQVPIIHPETDSR